MQESKFERNVQRQMEELKLRPSADVWEKVEEELRKKKRRRIVIFFFLLAGLGLIGYTVSTITAPSDNTKQAVTIAERTAKKEQESKSKEATTLLNGKDSQTNIQSSATESTIVGGEPSNKVQEQPANNNNTIAENKQRKKNKYAVVPGQQLPVSTMDSEKPVSTGSKTETQVIAPVVIENDATAKVQNANPTIADSTAAIAKTPIKDSVAEKLSEISTTAKKKSASKLRWGVELSGGISDRANRNLLDLVSSQYNQSSLNSPGAITGGYYITRGPSKVRAGKSFGIGAVVEIPLTKRSRLVTGLNYAFRSDRITVGSIYDTNIVVNNSVSNSYRVDAVYGGTVDRNFTNRYHFIQVPINYEFQIGKGKHLPFFWSLGAKVSYLFGSNAVIYDTANHGIYYRDAKAFHRMHVNVGTGFRFELGKNSKVNWSIGPDISFDLSRLIRNDYDPKQYLFYGGISARVFLPKKKK